MSLQQQRVQVQTFARQLTEDPHDGTLPVHTSRALAEHIQVRRETAIPANDWFCGGTWRLPLSLFI
jgi:hypothetical protein